MLTVVLVLLTFLTIIEEKDKPQNKSGCVHLSHSEERSFKLKG